VTTNETGSNVRDLRAQTTCPKGSDAEGAVEPFARSPSRLTRAAAAGAGPSSRPIPTGNLARSLDGLKLLPSVGMKTAESKRRSRAIIHSGEREAREQCYVYPLSL
jgi:hypothetical protein